MLNQNTLLGRCYFKKTDNGNLIGEFSNNRPPDSGIFTESADLIEGCKNEKCANCSYHGKYYSTWRENRTPNFAVLEISPKIGADKLFTLEWRDNKNVLIFEGEGMLCDGILIVDYHDTK